MNHLRRPVRAARLRNGPVPIWTGDRQEEVALRDDRSREGDPPEVSMIEGQHYEPALPPVELDRETEDRVRIRVWVAQQDVAGFGHDGVSLLSLIHISE